MGNQQLIILVIGVVIVGIATVVAIDAWDDNRTKAAADALNQDLAKMGADAQAWKQKPTPFGGQGNPAASLCGPHASDPNRCADEDFTGLDDLNQLGYNTTAGVFTNGSGKYAISGDPGAAGAVITGCNEQWGVKTSLTVDGLSSQDFVTKSLSSAPDTACDPTVAVP